MSETPRRPTASELAAASVSAGQVVTDLFSTPAGRIVTARSARVSWIRPTHLTLAGLAFGWASAVALLSAFSHRGLVLQLCSVAGFQLAYIFDCADGQLARLTGRTSDAGAELDVWVDVAVQSALVIVVASVAIEHGGVRPLLAGLFAVTWGVSTVATLMGRVRLDEWTTDSLRPSSWAVWVTRQLRDYPFCALVVSTAAAFSPHHVLPWVMAGFSTINGGALLAYIAARTRRSLRG